MLDGLNLGVSGSLGLGGGSSPFVAGAATPGSPTAATAAYGSGSTMSSSGASDLLGTSPGHLAIHAPTVALVLLVLIYFSLPK